ncbi:MAG: hypothetical protein AMS22_05335 [Thiotrichales bacterium SG8_50]|nr:MAG: hypothetical protein AMS22_05335 [Thiotrichales bacterium SG8_50]
MSKKLIFLTCFVLTIALATVTRADWVAYNDLSDGNGGTAALGMNVTTHTYLDANKALIDFDTGATLPVTITMEVVGDGDANGDVYPNNGGNCDAGTDADDIFGGILDLTGGNELDSTAEHKAIIFNGLDPGMSYTITLTSNRANSGYTDRWARVTIEGADAYTYAASAGVEKLSDASGEFCVGYNTVNGYVMKWTDISCGANGSFSIKSENADRGGKGYAMMAFKLEEFALGNALGNAYNPSPADGALHEDTWATLGWSPGRNSVSHDVYLSENFDDANNGTADTFRGNQADTTLLVGLPGFTFPEGLVPGTTYYWRIDEVNDADPNSPLKGKIWHFSIPPKTAYSPDPADGAEFVALDATLTWTPGFGAKLHTVYIGDNFEDVDNATGGTGRGAATYKPASPLESEKVYYWRVDEFDPPNTYKGDIWSFTTPGAVGNPDPANGAADVQMTAILSWTAADNAASHELYFGADGEAVKNATTASPEYIGPKVLGSESYDPGKLAWDTPYYWRVDEVYPAETVKGLVWSFATADFISVDDFESYNDIDPPDALSNRIFDKWIDGFGTTTNGALVGNDMPPYAEQSIVHGGAQSMPYLYDNANKTSEATLTLVYPRDWTEEGVAKLSLWFRGASGNAADRMFVALNGTAVVYHDDASATRME